MTLDILAFIDNKGGNAAEIRESQRKRGHSVEIVDEVIKMYTDWVKCASISMLHEAILMYIVISGLRHECASEESE